MHNCSNVRFMIFNFRISWTFLGGVKSSCRNFGRTKFACKKIHKRVLFRAVVNKRQTSSMAAGIGLQFAVSIVVFLYIGQWADKKFGTSPLFLLLGVFVGGGAAFYSMYRKLMAAQREEDEQEGRK